MTNQEHSKIFLSPIDPLGVPLYLSKGDDEIEAFNLTCEFCRHHEYSGWQTSPHRIYLLRGSSFRREGNIFGLLEISDLPAKLDWVLECLKEHNQSGGNFCTSNQKRGQSYRDCMIKIIGKACNNKTESDEIYLCGIGGSHIWIAERISGRRVFLMHF